MERKTMMTQAGWESEYQQNPIMTGGGMFPIDKFNIVPAINREEIKRSVRYWDKAATADGGAFTVGVLMHSLHDGRFVVGHVRRGQWSALEREKVIKSTAEMDKKDFARHFVYLESSSQMLPGLRSWCAKRAQPREYRLKTTSLVRERPVAKRTQLQSQPEVVYHYFGTTLVGNSTNCFHAPLRASATLRRGHRLPGTGQEDQHRQWDRERQRWERENH
jgi:hypothetical protein